MKWNNNPEGQSENGTNGDDGDNEAPSKRRVPFIIQRIGRGKKSEIEEITRMCVDVFFNERKEDRDDANGVDGETSKKRTPPWKALQLAYLRNFQEGDILARNAFKKEQRVDLVVARRVRPLSDAGNVDGSGKRVAEDESRIYNLDESRPAGGGYVAGEIVGYSEVSEKNFGLGGNFESGGKKRRDGTSGGEGRPRPYLSNLCVAAPARRSGVGSRLLDACEEAVRDWDAGHAEMVLQVEEDNPSAIRFYEGRGWEVAFADPACRSYDTSGFFLRERRVTKLAMVKRLDAPGTATNGGEGANGDDSGSFIQKLRNSFFVQ